MANISPTESLSINRLRIICLLCVVMIHSAVQNQPEAVVQLSAHIHQIADQMHKFYTALPCLQILFFLSGYLFFRNIGKRWNWHRDYLNKLKSRMISLVLPYLAWSAIYFIHQIIRHQGGYDYLTPSFFINGLWPLSGNVGPIVPVFWFLRVLICFTLLSPCYYFICRYCKHFTPLLCIGIILSPFPFKFAYFNAYLLLGAYFAYSGITLTSIGRIFPWKAALALIGSGLAIFLPPYRTQDVEYRAVSDLPPTLLGATEGIRLPSFCSPAAGMFLYASHFYVCIFLGVRCVRNLPLNLLMLNADMWISFIGATVLLLVIFIPLSRSSRLTFLLTGGRTAS